MDFKLLLLKLYFDMFLVHINFVDVIIGWVKGNVGNSLVRFYKELIWVNDSINFKNNFYFFYFGCIYSFLLIIVSLVVLDIISVFFSRIFF